MEQFDQDGLGNETDEAETEREEQHEVAPFPGLRFLTHLPDDDHHPADQPADADGERPEFELLNAHENAPGGVIQGRASYAAGWGDANDRKLRFFRLFRQQNNRRLGRFPVNLKPHFAVFNELLCVTASTPGRPNREASNAHFPGSDHGRPDILREQGSWDPLAPNLLFCGHG